MFRRAMTIAATAGAGLAIACSSGGGSGPSETDARLSYSRSASVGGIEVEATWPGGTETPEALAEYPSGRYLAIEVGMDTHSGDLGSIDMVQASRLQASTDTLRPEAWFPSNDDSHHRSGFLVFPRGSIAGPATLTVALTDGIAELVWENVPGGG